MSSPSEKYAKAMARAAETRTVLHTFRESYEFEFDDFQIRACQALEAGKGVLVAAPTGAGKTIVGEFAVHLAVVSGTKCFYTTPIKALSNQKFHDLVGRYGEDNVGLLTGDNSINGEAPVVVMTTEVLRNMIYAQSDTLSGLSHVVMDEVHYLADRFRGPVWEEVILQLPISVRIAALSATVSNAEEFGEWLTTVRGETEVVVEEHRPVPLWQHVLVGDQLHDLYVEPERLRVNPELMRLARDEDRAAKFSHERPVRGQRRARGPHAPSRVEMLGALRREGLLPAIVFVFSRVGCDSAVRQCLSAGLQLTTASERTEIHDLVTERCSQLPEPDLHVLGYGEWLSGLESGLAAHHAGMLPAFKEVVEELFQRGLLMAVFATETLALGINMPAKSVVLERLVKWNGEGHVAVTAGEYTQLTGRAGRRGLDTDGHSVVVWHRELEPAGLAGLAATRTYPLRSSFRPSYNMAVNLVGRVGRKVAKDLLEMSFAQFQADRSVVGLTRTIRNNQETLQTMAAEMQCHLGDFAEYAALRARVSDLEKEQARAGAAARVAAAGAALAALRPGDVIFVPTGRRAGPAVVLDPGLGGADALPRPAVLTLDRQVRRLSVVDFPTPAQVVGRVRIPKTFSARSANSRRDLAALLKDASTDLHLRSQRPHREVGSDGEIKVLRTQLRAHPCHGCSDREAHARLAEKYHRVLRETNGIERRVANQTNSIGRQFERVCALLTKLGYLEQAGSKLIVTDSGRLLAGLYTELDLLAAECIRHGDWDELSAAELGAVVSALVFESRGADIAEPQIPTARIREALAALVRRWAKLSELEAEERLDFLREPDVGFCEATYAWARQGQLEAVLRDADLAAGDFVRATKQVIDLLDQVGAGGANSLGANANLAITNLRRGVVAYAALT
ncbi:MAG: DEAD/DEAH box helicase [Actinomycetes bacterium]